MQHTEGKILITPEALKSMREDRDALVAHRDELMSERDELVKAADSAHEYLDNLAEKHELETSGYGVLTKLKAALNKYK
jgi:vacuolar-type H+-ATPase subunit E/Vma4